MDGRKDDEERGESHCSYFSRLMHVFVLGLMCISLKLSMYLSKFTYVFVLVSKQGWVEWTAAKMMKRGEKAIVLIFLD